MMASAAPTANTRESTCTSNAMGSSVGRRQPVIAAESHHASTIAPVAPATLTTAVSMSARRIRSHRPAPSASRMAVSRWRSAERASIRPARLVQVRRSTRPATPSSAAPKPATGPRSSVAINPGGVSTNRKPSFAHACSRPSCPAIVFSDASAAVEEIPSRKRPIRNTFCVCRRSSQSLPDSMCPTMAIGTHTSGTNRRSVPRKPGGVTPSTVNGIPLTRTVRPTTPRSAPNADRQ